jgi:hypothetical protein
MHQGSVGRLAFATGFNPNKTVKLQFKTYTSPKLLYMHVRVLVEL